MSQHPWPFPALYNVLGVHPEASRPEIEDAWRRLTSLYRDDPERQQALAVAWAVLGDPERRALYDRSAVGGPENKAAEAARPLVTWAVSWLTTQALLLAVGVRDISTLLVVSYLVACMPAGWRVLARARRWLGMFGWLSGLYCMAVSPVVGTFIAPVQLARSVVALARLYRGWRPRLSIRRRGPRP